MLGHVTEITRDVLGERATASLDGQYVRYDRNEVGLEIKLALPGGASIDTSYDARHRVASRALNPARSWSAGGPFAGHIDRLAFYEYSPSNRLVRAQELTGQTLRYTYDARNRVTSRSVDDTLAEHFAYDARGNHTADGERRVYGVGDRLESKDNLTFAYDTAGKLVAKTVSGPNGESKIWRFHWNAQEHLIAVDCPDELRVEFTYDPFARRVQKQVFQSVAGQLALIRKTRFVWFGPSLVHEVVDEIGSETVTYTYAHTDRRVQPWAHSVKVGQSAPEWTYYVGDVINTPKLLVDGQGQVLAQYTHTTFGSSSVSTSAGAKTQVRFAGQYEDTETGLHYNVNRYYDPDLGRYISPDPMGLAAGENFFAYCGGDPVGRVDPFGLAAGHGVGCELDVTEGGDTNGTWVPYSENSHSPHCTKEGEITSGDHTKKRDENGKATQEKDVFDIPGAKRKGTDETTGTGGVHGKTQNREQTYAHTEQHACEWAEKNFPGKLKNSQMRLTGSLPPCPRCNERMAKFTKDHQSTVDYKWPTNNHVQYKGGEGPKVVSADASKQTAVDNMAAAYQTRNSYALKGEKIPSGKSGETEYRVFKKLKQSQKNSK